MELLLQREYHKEGTNGILRIDDKILCFTIELPWRNNIRMKSCIQEGRYGVVLRYSTRHKNHLMLTGVAGRTLILIHRATNASRQLRGCIAPVMELIGHGRGKGTERAFLLLMDTVFKSLEKGQQVWLTIEEMPIDNHL